MATKTSNYEFNKPEQNDFYDVDVQNENWDKVDEELSEFDDSGVTEDIKSFPDFLSKFVTGNKVAITLRNLKAGLQFVLHAGQIVNNCVTDNAGLPLSAAQGKALMDKYTQLYSEVRMNYWSLAGNATNIPDNSDLNTYITPGNYCLSSTASIKTLSNCPVDNAFVLKISKPIIGNYILQEYIDLVGHQAIRVYNPYDKMWTERKIALKDDLPNIYGVQFEKNNEYSDHVQTIKNIWNKFPDNKPFVCTLADSNKFVAVGYIYENRKYGAVLYLAFNGCGIVKCSGGNFSDTKL